MPPAFYCITMIDFTIVKIGNTTENGNVTVVMQRSADVTCELGEITGGRRSRIVVRAESLLKEIDETVSLDMDLTFKFENRPYTVPEGEENAGQVIDLEWIVSR